MAGLSVILRGTIDDRLNWAFNLYDLNKDGCITKEVQGHWRAGGAMCGVLGGDGAKGSHKEQCTSVSLVRGEVRPWP